MKLGGSNGCTCAAPPDTPSCPLGPGRASSHCCNTCSNRCATLTFPGAWRVASSSPARIQGLDLVPCEAIPLQGDLGEQGCEPPEFLPCLDLGYLHPIPVWCLEELQWWWSHSACCPLAQLACVIVLGHCSPLHCHAGQLSLPCHWKWVSSSLPTCLLCFPQPLVVCCCDSGITGWLGVPHCV